ncbi:MAG: hypothetical protein KF846_11980 [Cyclobacteriaceae bacterium]|nr:hypothetical protein [Cyclobacteriaceae bacterium]MBX2956869.1 hypothetical protein [Cyclobacteriaceae bacterium]
MSIGKITTGFIGSAWISLMLLSSQANAQEELINFFEAGKEDGSKLVTAYINPFVSGFSYALNGGWFHTAKPHKLGGFDINIAITPTFIPSSEDYFKPNELGLTRTRLVTPTDGRAPTVIGPKVGTTYELDADGNGTYELSIDGPKGLDLREELRIAPAGSPMIQIGIGLVKSTDLMIRFTPRIDLGNGDFKMLGFGVRHDIKQHIPGIKMLPFDLSLMAGYTNIEINVDMSGAFPSNTTAPQEMTVKFNAFLLEALISKKLAFATFFGGIGYNGINTNADIKGNYVFSQGVSAELNDPYSGSFKNNSMRLDAGLRLNLLAFYIYGNYSIQKYNALTVGLGFTFR